MLFGLVTLVGCADNTPKEPPPNTGAVFQQPTDVVHTAVKDALSSLSFAILREEPEYFEAVHLKPGETAKKNKGEIVGVWLKPRPGATLVLVDTEKTASGIAKQRDWEAALTRQIQKNLQGL